MTELDSEGHRALKDRPRPPGSALLQLPGTATVCRLCLGCGGPPIPAPALTSLSQMSCHSRHASSSLPCPLGRHPDEGESVTTGCPVPRSASCSPCMRPSVQEERVAGAETLRLAEERGSFPTYKAPGCIHCRLSFRGSQSWAGTPAAALSRGVTSEVSSFL